MGALAFMFKQQGLSCLAGIFLIIVGLQFFSLGLICEMIVNIEYKRNSDNTNKDKLK